MKGERIRIWASFLIAATVWGSTWLAIRLGLETVPPILAVVVRFLIAAAVLGLMIRIRNLSIPFTRGAIKVYLSMGLLTFAVPFALVYWGQQFIPSALGSILFAAFPFWAALFSHWMLPDERLDTFKVGGIIFGMLGIVIIFRGDLKVSNSMAFLGMSAIMAGVVLQALSLVQVKKWGKGISPITMNFVGMFVGLVFLAALSWFVERDLPVLWTTKAVGSVLYLSLVGSVLAYVAYYWLLKRVDVVYLSLTSFLNPIVAVLLGAVFLGERLAASVFTGALLVLTGIAIANWKSLYAKAVGRRRSQSRTE